MARQQTPKLPLVAVLLAAGIMLQALSSLGDFAFVAPKAPANQARHHGFTSRSAEQQTRSRHARRVMTISSPMADNMMNEEPPRNWLWGALLSCLWPVMCVTFLNEARTLNAAVAKFPPAIGACLYVALACIFWFSARSGIFGRSARALVKTLGRVQKKMGIPQWRVEVFDKAAEPLANVTNACLVFLAFNSVVNAVPEAAVFSLPRIMTFMDVNHDGLLGAADIKLWAYGFASRALVGFLALQASLFVQAAKEPPLSSIEEPQSTFAKFLSSLQRLQGLNHKTGQHSVQFAQSQEAVTVQLVDKAISVACWGFVVASWAALANMRLSALLTIGGVGGLAISISTRNVITNLMSGGLIFLNRAVVPGDEIQAGGVSGFVDQVRATNTIIYRSDGEPLIVPNSKLVSGTVVNASRREFFLLEKPVPVRVGNSADIPTVMAAMQKALEDKAALYQTKPMPGRHHIYQEPLVFLDSFEKGPAIKMRCYVDGDVEFEKVQQEIIVAVAEAAKATGKAGLTCLKAPPSPKKMVLTREKKEEAAQEEPAAEEVPVDELAQLRAELEAVVKKGEQEK